MKIAGQTVGGPNKVTLVLPREATDDIIFTAIGLTDLTEVDSLIQEPKPPAKQVKGGVEYDRSDPNFKLQMAEYNVKKMAWIVLKSLEPSDIEWSTVNLDKPSTWSNYLDELKEAGFSEVEVNRITNIVMQANALDDAKLDAARQSFLSGRSDQKATSGQPTPVENS